MENPTITVRFLLFPGGQQFVLSFNSNENVTIQNVKKKIVENWTQDLLPNNPFISIDDIKLIFSGQILKDNELLYAAIKPNDGAQIKDLTTIHIVLNKTLSKSIPDDKKPQQTAQNIIDQEQTQQDEEQSIMDWDSNIHFHGCLYDEEEAEKLHFVFEKKSKDSTMSILEVEKFLRTYWRWMASNNYKHHVCNNNNEFPLEHFNDVKARVLVGTDRVTCDQFFQIFFLFDNDAPENECPHGSIERVKRSTEELHKALQPDTQFADEVFDDVFNSIDLDQDGKLSCKEVELLYYLYSLQVRFAESKEDSNISNNNNNTRIKA